MQYFEGFDDTADIERNFGLSSGILYGADILIAYYTSGGYDGSAFVLFRENGKLYTVVGSHCSCHGLEGQWDPEETSIEELHHFLDKGDWGSLAYSEQLQDVIDFLKKGIKVKKITWYEATDGSHFSTEAECIYYEQCYDLKSTIRGAVQNRTQCVVTVNELLSDHYTLIGDIVEALVDRYDITPKSL